MSNKVDKLFKDKLESHSLPPSAQAWEKVEAHLGKKNKMGLALRVAAAVALLGVLTFVGINWSNSSDQKQELVKEEPKKIEPKVVEPKEKEHKEEIKQAEKVERAPVAVEQRQTKKTKTQPVVEQPKEQEHSLEQPSQQPVEQIAAVDLTPTQQPSHQATQQPSNQATQQPSHPATQPPAAGITLTYSLPPVKKEIAEPAIAQSEEKKTGFERVLAIAREVKNGDPLGELREAKDDIFALDFRKDKNKKQH